MTQSHHEKFMAEALTLAELGRGRVSPNPMVGCVIVKDSIVIGKGFHKKAGEPHAEIHALQETNAKDATLYVTLEPCAHEGRTPPCVDAIIKAGIKQVVIACLDPNPLVNGRGVAALKAAGIQVEVGTLESQAKKLNEIFFHYILHKRPFVICKWAMSLDGKTITNPNDSKQISGRDSQVHTHTTRSYVDAILVGANTINDDDPELTVRFANVVRQPLRIILSSNGELKPSAKIFAENKNAKTLLITTENSANFPKHIEVCVLPKDKNGLVDLNLLLDELVKRQITSLLVEGGMQVHQQFISAKLVNKLQVYVAPVIIANLPNKISLESVSLEKIDKDFLFETYL